MALTPVLMPVPFGSEGTRNEIPIEPSETNENFASYRKGFPDITMLPIEAGGIAPEGGDMNGILYALTANDGYWQTGMLPRFDNDFCEAIGGYQKGAVLQTDTGRYAYVSLVDNNTYNFNENPEYIGEYWTLWAGEFSGSGSGGSISFANAGGTSDVITATFEPAFEEFTDGMMISFRATAANKTVTPSFQLDSLQVLTIVKEDGKAVAAGDIPGEGALVLLQYSASMSRWVLLNPAVDDRFTELERTIEEEIETEIAAVKTDLATTNSNVSALKTAVESLQSTSIYTASGTFTVPTGVTQVTVTLQAGGGGGAGMRFW